MENIKSMVLEWLIKNRWIIGSTVTFLFSFIFPGHFLQFLAAALIMATKWIIDSKATKMLVMIHEAWKRGDAGDPEKFSRNFQQQNGGKK